MLLRPILIGRNEHGYYAATGDINCVLLSTLNLLKDAYGIDHHVSGRIINRWAEFLNRDARMEFLAPAQIPLTIESLTDGVFFGRVISPYASRDLRTIGIPEKYALDSAYIDPSMLPLIYASEGNPIGHAVAALRFDPTKGFHVIDDGRPMDMATLPTPGIAYKIERNLRR